MDRNDSIPGSADQTVGHQAPVSQVSLRAQVISGFRWVAGMRLISQVFAWAVTIVVIRLLSPTDYGLLAMATVFIEFFTMIAEFGIGAALVQAPEIDDQTLRKLFGFAIVVNVALFAVMCLTAPMNARFFREPRVVTIVRVLSVQYVLMIFSVVPQAQLARKLNYKGPAVIELSAAITASVTTLVLALAGAGVWALVWGSLAATLCRTVGLNLLSPFARWPVFGFRGTSQLLAFGGNVTATRIMWFFYSQADIIIGGRILGKDLLGLYSVAMHLASLPARKSSAIINQVSFPAFARIQDDRQRYASSFLLAVRSLSFVLFPVLWGMSSVAPEMVSVLLGDKWTSATVPFQLLALIMPIHMFAPFMNTAAQGIGRADIAAKQVFVSSLVMPTAFMVGSHWGLTGLAMAWLLGFPVVFIVAMRLFLPVIELRVRDLLAAMARPVVASAGMAAGVTLIRIPLESGGSLSVRLTVLVVAGVVTYGALTWFVNKGGLREIVGIIKG